MFASDELASGPHGFQTSNAVTLCMISRDLASALMYLHKKGVRKLTVIKANMRQWEVHVTSSICSVYISCRNHALSIYIYISYMSSKTNE